MNAIKIPEEELNSRVSMNAQINLFALENTLKTIAVTKKSGCFCSGAARLLTISQRQNSYKSELKNWLRYDAKFLD